METLQLALRFGEGALQAALVFREAVEEGDLVRGAVGGLEDFGIGGFQAGQFPLRGGHLLKTELFGGGLRAPFGFEGVAELSKFVAIFTGEDEGLGAQAVAEGVHGDNGLARRRSGPGGFERVTAVRVDLFLCRHLFCRRAKPLGRCVRN